MNDDVINTLMGAFDFLKDGHNYTQRNVERFEDGKGLVVSTARVSDGLLPFETGVTHPGYNKGETMILEAYRTRDEARSGHRRWIATMTTEPLPNRLEDCYNSKVAQIIKLLGEKLEYPKE